MLNSISPTFSASAKKTIIIITVLLGFSLRILSSARGHNYDFDSYLIVLNIIKHGGNVYAETTRYNYGPVWFWILKIIYNISAQNQIIFRSALVIFLSFVDFGIFIILLSRYKNLSAYFFFLNPISIIITGYHNQFDNLAILIALYANMLIGEDFDKPLNKKKYTGLVILGISLATKHLFFFYPIWLSIKQKGKLNKLIIISTPLIVFLLSFAPYLNSGLYGVINNVFLYKSYLNGMLYSFFVPVFFQMLFSSMSIWILVLVFFGFYLKNIRSNEAFFYYTCILVAASPAIANQYLAIPVSYLLVNGSVFSALYMLGGLIHLLIDYDGLHIFSTFQESVLRQGFYLLLVTLLWAHLIHNLWKNEIKSYRNNILNEIKQQFF